MKHEPSKITDQTTNIQHQWRVEEEAGGERRRQEKAHQTPNLRA
jgi:hypothetical protein